MASTGVCMGTHNRYPPKKYHGIAKGYYDILGNSWCSKCDKRMFWMGLYCPCCGVILRKRPRQKDQRDRWLELNVKRI